jgi:hypothetical protein
VLASPPSRLYRISKFVRRHKWASRARAALVLALALGITGTTLALVRAVRAGAAASQEAKTAPRTSDFLTGLFEVVGPRGSARQHGHGARDPRPRRAAHRDELAEDPEVRASLMGTMGAVYAQLGLFPKAPAALARLGRGAPRIARGRRRARGREPQQARRTLR